MRKIALKFLAFNKLYFQLICNLEILNLLLSQCFQTPLSPNKLIYQTLPLLEYGKANDCRFFVQIIDKTGAEKKELYKDLRQAVETNFYILKRN